jgi:hypothetical protein
MRLISRRPESGPGPDKLLSMNPRYRRMVIPGALVLLIVIVVVSAVLHG